MEVSLSHNHLILHIIDNLFEAEFRRLEKKLTAINIENKQLLLTKIDGFLHLDKFYRPNTGTLMVANKDMYKNALHKNLWRMMDEHIEDIKNTNKDKLLVKQTLVFLLSSCIYLQEIRNALPECLVNILIAAGYASVSSIKKTAPTAYTIQDNPRALRQYEKILPLMEMYSVTKLLY